MKDNIEEIKGIIDVLTIETALNTAHLKTLTIAFWELSGHLLKADESKNLQSHYYHTLYEKSSEILNSTDLVYRQSNAQKALLELHSFVQSQLRDLET